MPNPNFPGELGSIPYRDVIGGPLNAAVEANADASMTAAKFIQDVGFEDASEFGGWDTPDKPVYVTFHYKKETIDEDGVATEKEFDMKVPLLLLLHVPYFEVSNVTIDFNVKLQSIEKFATSSKFNIESETKGKAGWFVANVKWSVSTSYQRKSSHAQEIQRSYDQSVHVEAQSIDAPEGVTKLLGVLEQTITEDTNDDGESE